MPVHTLRETIVGSVFLDASGRGYFTKRINVPEHMRNQVMALDVTNENVCPFIPATTDNILTGVQMFVSPYPIQITDNTIQPTPTDILENAGPYASDAKIISKQTEITRLNNFQQQQSNKIWHSQFPNDSLGSQETTTFYSPHLYLTVLLWNAPDTEVEIKYSVYAEIKQTKCNAVESAMGCYGEFLDAQCMKLLSTAVFTSPDNVAGNTFPMWKYGGIRPEFMISGTTALRYFNRVASNQSQAMISRDDFQVAFQEATKMAEFDSGFGDPAIPLPDWVQILDVAGITSGAIRPYPPPLKFADNGNTLMF